MDLLLIMKILMTVSVLLEIRRKKYSFDLNINEGGIVHLSSLTYKDGDIVYIKIYPYSNKIIDQIIVKDINDNIIVVKQIEKNIYSFIHLDSQVTIEVLFKDTYKESVQTGDYTIIGL